MEIVETASCDSQGTVYISSDAVYRVIDPKHERSVIDILKAIESAQMDCIVPTEICTDKPPLVDNRYSPGGMVLKHKRIAYISYPHEWCAPMLQDAALFHLDLSVELSGQGLFLKDAHPWNILLEKGRPVFVDFTSIVTKDDLFEEAYLESNSRHHADTEEDRLARVVREIFDRMYLPYFVTPLAGYAFGRRARIRKAIENTTLNASTSVISLWQSLPTLRPRLSTVVKSLRLLMLHLRTRRIMRRLIENNDPLAFYQEMRRHVKSIGAGVGKSDYMIYYKLKGEDHDWTYSEKWNAKQKNVYNALDNPAINTVVDVACNTGWYAVLAAKLGKQVVAFDIDEACIEVLYDRVKSEQLNIMPLVLNFTELTQDRYSIHDEKRVLINANQRLRSDSVIALGIIHHLTLGMGLGFDELLDKLTPLCEKQLIVEFVDAEDAMIQNEPDFFPACFRNRSLLDEYKLQNLIEMINSRGFEVCCKDSYPSTRTILVCNRRSPS